MTTLFSCHNSDHNTPAPDWSTISIVSENRTNVIVRNDNDTSKIFHHNYGNFFGGYHKDKVDTALAIFSSAQRDSIFQLTRQIISDAIQPKVYCTDFVGELKLAIDYGGRFREPGTYEQSINYSGICQWDTLSTQTKELHRLLAKKIKGI